MANDGNEQYRAHMKIQLTTKSFRKLRKLIFQSIRHSPLRPTEMIFVTISCAAMPGNIQSNEKGGNVAKFKSISALTTTVMHDCVYKYVYLSN